MPKLRKAQSTAITTPDLPEVPAAIVDLRRLIDGAVTESDWAEIIRVAMDGAKKGDNRSRDFLFKYRFGLPPQMVQHSGKVGMGIAIVEVQRESGPLPDDPAEIIENE